MSAQAQLYFIYDCLCPWSYATTPLINEVNEKLAGKVEIVLLNSAYFGGTDSPDKKQLAQVKELSTVTFSEQYVNSLAQEMDSTLSANVMAWVSKKEPKYAIELLNNFQELVFQQGKSLNLETVTNQLAEHKLFAPAKSLKDDKLTKDAQFDLGEIEEIQNLIGTNAIPALLLTIGDDLILLNHNLYLSAPSAIVEAINLELNN
jgi:protein-disulfide isomerase-like protein with CxxC motif